MRLWLTAALAVAGCNTAETPPPPPPPDQAVEGPEPRQDLPDEQRSPDLFGAWLVESVEAPDPVLQERSWDTILLVGLRQLEVLSQCITIGPFDYGRTTGGGISVTLTPVAPRPRNSAVPAPIQCARAHSPAERTLPKILLAAREVEARNGKVILSGPAGTMILRRPDGPLRNPRGNAPAPAVPPLLGAWKFVTVNDRKLPASERMELLLRPNRLEWRSGCVNEARALEVDRNVLRPGATDPFPVCERGRSEAELAVGRLFERPIATRMQRDGRLLLEGVGVAAELHPLTN